MAVNIILTVAGQGSGSGGESREFAYSLTDPTPPLTTLSLDDVTGVTSYLWELLNQPIGASAVLSSDSVASPTFTPTAKAWGTYLIRCTITRNGSQEVGTVALSFWTPIKDMRFPAAGEKTEFSDTNGWMEAEYALYDIVDNLSLTGYWSRTSTRLHPLNSGDTLQVGSGNINYPSYAYESDPDCGRYLYSTGVEAFATSGNAQILFGNDGNPYIKAVDGHNILTIGNYKTVGGGEAELLIEADGNAITDGATINFNAKSTATKTSIINILSDSDNGVTDLNLTSDAGDTGTSSDIDITAYGGTATINITATRTGTNSADINLDSNDDLTIHASEIVTVESGTNKASLVLYPPTIPNPNGEIRFSSNYIYNNWTDTYITLSDSSTEDSTYTSNFGQVSIFAALNYLYSAGGGGGVTLTGAYNFGGAGVGRSIYADTGAVEIVSPDASNNAALKLLQQDVTNDKDALDIYNAGTGYSIYMHGTTNSIYGSGNLKLISSNELHFTDSHTEGGGSNWGWSYIPLTTSDAQWLTARALLGDTEGSLFELIFAAASYGSGGLNDAYDFGGAGSGRSVTTDSGAVAFTVPSSGSNSALALTNQESTNTSEVLSIYNDATLSTGYAAYLQGNAGGSTTDYNELGHLIWTPGSSTIGHGHTTDGVGNSRAYTNYHFREIDVASWSAATMRAESGSSWGDYAYVRVFGSTSPAIQLSTTGTINVYDGYETGSTWTGSSIALSSSSQDWTDVQTLITAQSKSQSIFGAILAAAAAGGGAVSRPDTEIIWGTGSSYSSEGNFTYNDAYNQLRIINNHNETNWYDTNAASVLLQGTATQGPAVVANGDLTIGSIHSTQDNTLNIIAKNDDATNSYYPTINIETLPTAGTKADSSIDITANYYGNGAGDITIQANGNGGEGFNGGIIDIIAYAPYTSDQDHYLNLYTKVNTTSYGIGITPTNISISNCNLSIGGNKIYGINNAAYGTATSASFATNTLTLNFNTGKDFQIVSVADDVDNLSLTAPANGVAKGLLIKIINSDSSTHTVGGGTGWSGVDWPLSGTDLDADTITLEASGGYVLILFCYDGSSWSGSTIEYGA